MRKLSSGNQRRSRVNPEVGRFKPMVRTLYVFKRQTPDSLSHLKTICRQPTEFLITDETGNLACLASILLSRATAQYEENISYAASVSNVEMALWLKIHVLMPLRFRFAANSDPEDQYFHSSSLVLRRETHFVPVTKKLYCRKTF